MSKTPTLLRLPDVMKRTGLPRSTIYARIAKDAFPRQIQLAPRTVCWIEGEITEWIESKIISSRAFLSMGG